MGASRENRDRSATGSGFAITFPVICTPAATAIDARCLHAEVPLQTHDSLNRVRGRHLSLEIIDEIREDGNPSAR